MAFFQSPFFSAASAYWEYGLFPKRTASPWVVFPKYKAIRFLVLLAAFILAWVYSTYDLNLYSNQWHISDRLLLVFLLPLIWWRPVFVWPFILFLFPIIEQLTAVEGFSWAIPFLPFQVLTCFAVYFLLYVLTKSNRAKDFLFFVTLIYITHYWNSGCFKLNMFWVLNDQVNFLMPNTYANGWLGFLPPEQMAAFAKSLSVLNPFIRPMVVFLEIGCMFVLFHRQLPKIILIGLIGFHAGVFVYSGICFWVWMLMDFGLLLLFIRKDAFAEIFKFKYVHLALFLVLLYFNRFWQKTQPLSWFDVPMTYTYIIEAKTEDGKLYNLPPNFFAPFDFQFTLGNMGYLNKNQIMPIVWGASSEENAKWFLETQTSEEIFEREKTKGEVGYDEKRSAAFGKFMQQYIKNWNERLTKNNWLTALQPPRYLWTFPKDPFPEGGKRITEITVFELTTLFQNGKYSELRKRALQRMVIEK